MFSFNRWLIWIPLLVVTIYWSFQNSDEEDDSVEEIDYVNQMERSLLREVPKIDVEQIAPRLNEMALTKNSSKRPGNKDLFSAHDWNPPAQTKAPPPSAPAPAPAKISAPPIPYLYIGKLETENGVSVFLNRLGETLIAKKNDVLESKYRIEEITVEKIEFRYLPLDEVQTLVIGEK